MIRIKAKRNGFRRAGMAHPADWREYPDGKFDGEQFEALVNEPMLQVVYVPDKPAIVPDEPQPAEEVIPVEEQPPRAEASEDKPAASRKGRKK